MKKATKLGCTLLAMACALTSMGALTGCKKTPNSAQDLEVKLSFSGYGQDFAKNMLNAFKEQDWVKEKYPKLNIIFDPDTNGNDVYGAITAGAKATTADLIFTSTAPTSLFDKINPDDGKYYLADLHDVFYGEVPGEGILFKDKLVDGVDESCLPTIIDGEDAGYKKYQFLPGMAGTSGIYFNFTYLDELTNSTGIEYDLPLTTNQLVKLCADIKGAKKAGSTEAATVKDPFGNLNAPSPIVSVRSSNYWSGAFGIWWSQYQGAEDKSNYNWISDFSGERNTLGWLQYGRLEAFRVMEDLLSWKNGYTHRKSSGVSYIESEKHFFNRGSAMMWNGDWLEEELNVAKAQAQDDIRLIDTPVISAIVDVCSDTAFPSRYVDFNFDRDEDRYGTVDAQGKPVELDYAFNEANCAKADEMLAWAVNALRVVNKPSLADFNAAYSAQFPGYAFDQRDLDLIYRAANLESRMSQNEVWVVPNYAVAKEVAMDFLRFTATDEAIKLQMKGHKSLTTFKMSDELKAEILADESFSDMLKERVRKQNRKIWESGNPNPYGYRAGLRDLNECYLIEMMFADSSAGYKNAYGMWNLEYARGIQRVNNWTQSAGMDKETYVSAPYLHADDVE